MAKPKGRINLYRPVLGAGQTQVQMPGKPWWLLGVILVVGLIGVSFALQLVQGWKLSKEIKARQADRDQLRSEQELAASQLKLLTSGLSAQVTTASAELVEVIQRRVEWRELFQEMSVRVPDGVWLVRVKIEAMMPPRGTEGTRAAQKRTIVLEGFARSHQNVGQLLSALEQSPKFAAITLKFADRRVEKAVEQVNFEIDGQLL
jgi:Tfp pilus assembly protein PilN